MVRSVSWLLLGICVCGSTAHADAPSTTALLSDPVQLGAWLHAHDPVVESTRARLDGAKAAREQARVLPNPQLAIGFGNLALGRGNLSNGMTGPTSVTDVANINLTVSELVELGKRTPRQQAAAARVEAMSELGIAALGDRITQATLRLGRLAYLVARRDVIAANLDAAHQLRDLEKVRLDKSDLSEAEFSRIVLDTELLGVLLGRADADLAGAAAGCASAVFAPCTTTGIAPDALDAAAALVGVPASIPDAIHNRPARRAVGHEARALGWDATLASRRSIPDVTVGLGYTFDNYEYSGSIPQTVSLSLAIPIPLFDRGHHDAAVARSAARAARAESRAGVTESRGAVDALLAQRTMLEQTLRDLATGAVPRSTHIVGQTRRAFDLGQVRLADLLLVERTHRDLLLQVLDTRFELFNVRVQLRQELGLDDEIGRTVMERVR